MLEFLNVLTQKFEEPCLPKSGQFYRIRYPRNEYKAMKYGAVKLGHDFRILPRPERESDDTL